jgi:hypothetical protein
MGKLQEVLKLKDEDELTDYILDKIIEALEKKELEDGEVNSGV